MRRAGSSLFEVAVAAFVLALVAVPVLSLASGARTSAATCLRRVQAELRAREHLAEAAATEHGGLLSLGETSLPTQLSDASDPAERFGALVRDLKEYVHAEEAVPGLARVTALIAWTDMQSGRPQRARALRLIVRPTLCLEDRVPRAQLVVP